MKRLSRQNQERNMHRSSTVCKPKQFKTFLNKYIGGFWCERTKVVQVFLTLEEVLLWIMEQTHSSLLHKIINDGLQSCRLLVDYCDVFISCLDSHSDGTHSLQKINWWANDVMPNFPKSVLMKKQCNFKQIFILGWTIPCVNKGDLIWLKIVILPVHIEGETKLWDSL